MRFYDYKCDACGKKFEVPDGKLKEKCACGCVARRVISMPSTHFIGRNFSKSCRNAITE